MTMENLVISASRVEIDTESDRTLLVDIQMSTAEYESVLKQYREEDIARIVGARGLLENMGIDDIISYVNDTGIMETQEDRP